VEQAQEQAVTVNLRYILETGLGVLNYTPEQLFETRLCFFWARLSGYFAERDRQYRAHAELTRLQTFLLVNVNMTEKSRLKSPADLYRYHWEDDQSPSRKRPELSDAQIEQRSRNLLKAFDHGRSLDIL
jgi:hypothetical protein